MKLLRKCQFLIGNVKLYEKAEIHIFSNFIECQFLIGNVKRKCGEWRHVC